MRSQSQDNRRRAPRSLLAAVVISAIGLLLWACDSVSSILGPTSPCETYLAGECGAPCMLDDACPAGQYCNDGQCWADCTPSGGECFNGWCDDRGRCHPGTGGTGGTSLFGGSAGQGGGTGGACGEIQIDFEPVTPTVVLLIDQSGSMNENFPDPGDPGDPDRWDVVYDVLMDPAGGVVRQLEDVVRFGLVLYTNTHPAGSAQCPDLVEWMPPALNAYDEIDAVYAPQTYLSDTPTGDSIYAITPDLVAFSEPGPKLIVLATDGEPDRCEDPDGHDQVSRDLATDAAQAAYAQGIELVIIAVGVDTISGQHQQDMANAGMGLPVPAPSNCTPTTCAPTYEPTTQQEMIDAFMDIINGQRTCVFALNGEVIAGKECDGVVEVNGVPIPCNDPDGWQLNGASEIEFLGSTCDTIMNDPNVTIDAWFPCESIAVPPT